MVENVAEGNPLARAPRTTIAQVHCLGRACPSLLGLSTGLPGFRWSQGLTLLGGFEAGPKFVGVPDRLIVLTRTARELLAS